MAKNIRRFGWFILLWAAGVLVVGIVSLFIRWVLL
jgi:hypothetical protein